LLDIPRGIGTDQKGPVGVPKGMPSNASEFVLSCKLATLVMDWDGMTFSTVLINFGACRPGTLPFDLVRL
jgi:hypothetical protein